MHDIKWIREHPDDFDRALKRRGLSSESEKLIALDEQRRAAIRKAEGVQARRNAVSKEIGAVKKNKDEVAAAALMAEVNELKAAIPALEKQEKVSAQALDDALAEIPNLPSADVPDGKDEHDNVEHHHFGAKRNFSFQPKQHFELGETLGQMDFETAAKLSGSRFVVLKKGLARLERALAQFMLDVHTGEHGYAEVNPPVIVNSDAMFGTAQLPKFRADQYTATREIGEIPFERAKLEADGYEVIGTPTPEEKVILDEAKKLDALPRPVQTRGPQGWGPVRWRFETRQWLIPTAEVSLTNLVSHSIREEAELPLRYTAYTPCFRAEAGAAGKDTRGMIRQHQFNKVGLVSITTPEQSKDEHERMLSCAEEVLRKLGLHYRVVTLCTGDMGFASQKTYDIEVWLPGQGMYREISSCSNCGDFQARRMAARYRAKAQKNETRFVHTLNGSGTAVGRALIAVMETYQDEGGRIAVPDVLQGYMGGMKVVEKSE